MLSKIQVVGLYRTGTHFMQEVLNHCFDQNPPFLGDRAVHAYQYQDLPHPKYSYVMMYKDPVHWIDSIARKAFDLPRHVEWFVDEGDDMIWIPDQDDFQLELWPNKVPLSLQALARYYNNHVDLWNSMRHRYNIIDVNYDEFMEHPRPILDEISWKLGIPVTTYDFEVNMVRFSEDYVPWSGPRNLTGEQVEVIDSLHFERFRFS